MSDLRALSTQLNESLALLGRADHAVRMAKKERALVRERVASDVARFNAALQTEALARNLKPPFSLDPLTGELKGV